MLLRFIEPTIHYFRLFTLVIVVLLIIISVSTACSPPACIQCQNIPDYPNTTICRETYETALTEDTPSWREYADEAIRKGCIATE